MHTLLRKIRLTAAFVTTLTFLVTGLVFGGIDDTLKKSFTVELGGKLTLETDLGSIEVQAAKGNSVDVEVIRKVKTSSEKKAQKTLDDFKIKFDQSGKDVYIKAEYKKKGWAKFWDNNWNRLHVKFVITVPRIYEVELKTSGGSISVDHLQGEVNSRTSGGSLHFNNITGAIWGKTSGGSIKIGKVDGDVDVRTSGGSITVKEVMGAIQAATSGGSVKAYISRQPESDCRLTTSGGSVTVYLAEGIGVDLDAGTSGGRVHTEFPVTIRGEISERRLKAKINGGGPELYLHTSGGSVYIKKM